MLCQGLQRSRSPRSEASRNGGVAGRSRTLDTAEATNAPREGEGVEVYPFPPRIKRDRLAGLGGSPRFPDFRVRENGLLYCTSIQYASTMKVSLQLMYEDGGRPVAKWRESFVRHDSLPVGTFRLCSDFVKELNSHVIKAQFRPDTGDEIRDLYRAQVLYVKDHYITVTGLEHDPVFNKYTAQTWCLAVLTP